MGPNNTELRAGRSQMQKTRKADLHWSQRLHALTWEGKRGSTCRAKNFGFLILGRPNSTPSPTPSQEERSLAVAF